MMGSFDKKLRKLSKNMKVPETYKKKVDETLINLPVEKESALHKKCFSRKRIVQIAICVVVVVCIGLASVSSTDANIFTAFKKTIMNFFNSEGDSKPEELGVESQQNYSQSKPELLLELRESVIDRSSVYLLVKITAPANVEFDSKVGFDYFAFSYGENFNTEELLGGVKDCTLLEVSEEENAAIFVVSLSCEQEITEGAPLSVCFKDFTRDPYGEKPELLVEGMWSLSFVADYTVTDRLSVAGTDEMKYIFLGDEATVRGIEVTPLGMELSSWVTAEAYELSAVSDSRLDIRLKLLDGSEIKLMSHDLEEPTPQVSSGSLLYSEDMEHPYMTYKFDFEDVLNLNQILGVYVEELYIPFKNMEE